MIPWMSSIKGSGRRRELFEGVIWEDLRRDVLSMIVLRHKAIARDEPHDVERELLIARLVEGFGCFTGCLTKARVVVLHVAPDELNDCAFLHFCVIQSRFDHQELKVSMEGFCCSILVIPSSA